MLMIEAAKGRKRNNMQKRVISTIVQGFIVSLIVFVFFFAWCNHAYEQGEYYQQLAYQD